MQSLNTKHRVKYSEREKSVFQLIAEVSPDRISTKEIGEKIFKGKVFHVKSSVVAALSSLRKKVEYNEEPFTIEMTGHSGPHAMEVWIQPRKTEME